MVRIEIEGGGGDEGYEQFFFLSGATNATIAETTSLIGIVDSQPVADAPSLFVRDVTVGREGRHRHLHGDARRPGGQSANGPVTVDYATSSSGTNAATADLDYSSATGTLSFAAGESVKTVTVDIADDATAEGFERFFDLSNATGGANIPRRPRGGPPSARERRHRAAQPRISVSDMVVDESAGYVGHGGEPERAGPGPGDGELPELQRHRRQRNRPPGPQRHAHLRRRRDHQGGAHPDRRQPVAEGYEQFPSSSAARPTPPSPAPPR